jgi:hypothetical protein
MTSSDSPHSAYFLIELSTKSPLGRGFLLVMLIIDRPIRNRRIDFSHQIDRFSQGNHNLYDNAQYHLDSV